MKTEQEQIEKMARTMCGYCSTDGKCAVSKNGREPDVCANVDTQHCLYKEYAERLIDSSYGKVSEYKAENERLTNILNSLTFSKKETDIFGKPALLMFAGVKVEEAIKRVTEYNGLKAEIERLEEENEQRRKLGILGNEVTVEFHDDEVSEHSVYCNDIEKYAKQFRNRIISINEKEIKQAKIDVLNELKTRHDYAIKNMGYPWDISQQIDELIKEVENDK